MHSSRKCWLFLNTTDFELALKNDKGGTCNLFFCNLNNNVNLVVGRVSNFVCPYCPSKSPDLLQKYGNGCVVAKDVKFSSISSRSFYIVSPSKGTTKFSSIHQFIITDICLRRHLGWPLWPDRQSWLWSVSFLCQSFHIPHIASKFINYWSFCPCLHINWLANPQHIFFQHSSCIVFPSIRLWHPSRSYILIEVL